MVDQVDQGILAIRLVKGRPIADVLDAMLVEQVRGVVAETGVEGEEMDRIGLPVPSKEV